MDFQLQHKQKKNSSFKWREEKWKCEPMETVNWKCEVSCLNVENVKNPKWVLSKFRENQNTMADFSGSSKKCEKKRISEKLKTLKLVVTWHNIFLIKKLPL